MNKISGLTPCIITMNAGDSIPGSIIKWTIKNQLTKFEKAIIIDGQLTDSAKEFYSQFSNLEIVDSPWRDSYVDQYKAWASRLKDGEWALHLDCDEAFSDDLLKFAAENNWAQDSHYLYYIPCILYITENGKDYYAAENKPDINFHGQWTKSILIKKHSSLTYNVQGSHVIMYHSNPEINSKKTYLPKAYTHNKSLESFIYNDVWQAFLQPLAQQYSPTNASKFKMLTGCYKTTKEFKLATQKGTWSPPLKKFAWDHRHECGNPISRLAWVYYILEGHPMPEKDDFMVWEAVRRHVLDEEKFSIIQKNKRENNKIEIDRE